MSSVFCLCARHKFSSDVSDIDIQKVSEIPMGGHADLILFVRRAELLIDSHPHQT